MKDYIEIPVKEYKLLVEKAMKYDLMKTEQGWKNEEKNFKNGKRSPICRSTDAIV